MKHQSNIPSRIPKRHLSICTFTNHSRICLGNKGTFAKVQISWRHKKKEGIIIIIFLKKSNSLKNKLTLQKCHVLGNAAVELSSTQEKENDGQGLFCTSLDTNGNRKKKVSHTSLHPPPPA